MKSIHCFLLVATALVLPGCIPKSDTNDAATVPEVTDGLVHQSIAVSHPWAVAALQRADDDTLIAALSHDQNYLEVWSVDANRSVASLGSGETGFHPDDVRWVDWDGDGKSLELLVTVEGERKLQLWQIGFWGLKHLSTFAVIDPPQNLVSADLDGDGHLDIVVGPYEGERITILWGKGDFDFATSYLPTLQTPAYPALTDWDRDGDLDIVWSDWESGSVQFAAYQSDRQFESFFLQEPVSGTAPRQVLPYDIDRDGHPDLVVSQEVAKAAKVLFNDGTGQVRESEDIPAPQAGYSAVAATQHEGRVLLAMSESDAIILSLQGDGQWQQRNIGGHGLMLGLDFVDIDRDGHEDLIYAKSSGEGLVIVYGPVWKNADEGAQ